MRGTWISIEMDRFSALVLRHRRLIRPNENKKKCAKQLLKLYFFVLRIQFQKTSVPHLRTYASHVIIVISPVGSSSLSTDKSFSIYLFVQVKSSVFVGARVCELRDK